MVTLEKRGLKEEIPAFPSSPSKVGGGRLSRLQNNDQRPELGQKPGLNEKGMKRERRSGFCPEMNNLLGGSLRSVCHQRSLTSHCTAESPVFMAALCLTFSPLFSLRSFNLLLAHSQTAPTPAESRTLIRLRVVVVSAGGEGVEWLGREGGGHRPAEHNGERGRTATLCRLCVS